MYKIRSKVIMKLKIDAFEASSSILFFYLGIVTFSKNDGLQLSAVARPTQQAHTLRCVCLVFCIPLRTLVALIRSFIASKLAKNGATRFERGRCG